MHSALKCEYELTMQHAKCTKASLKEKKQVFNETRTRKRRAEATKQHEAPTTNTKAIMVIKEADLFLERLSMFCNGSKSEQVNIFS